MSNPITQILGTEKVSRERFNQIISESNTAFNNIESKIPTITGISLNTVLTPGVYLFKDCILEVESVSQTVSGMLYVVMYGPSDIYQAIQVLSNGYFTRIYSGSEWTSLTFHPYTLQSDLAVVATSGSYNDLVGKPQDNTFVYTLTHTKSGNVHKLTGLSGVSRIVSCQFKATAGYNAALDTLTVDGVSYTIKLSSGEKAEDNLFVSGAIVSCIVDTSGKTVNFKAGGGLSASKLALATAATSDVLAGKTFYAGDKALKTGGLEKGYKRVAGTITKGSESTVTVTCGFNPTDIMICCHSPGDFVFIYPTNNGSMYDVDGIFVSSSGSVSKYAPYELVTKNSTGFTFKISKIIGTTFYYTAYGKE